MSNRLNALRPRDRLAVPSRPIENTKTWAVAASVHGHAQAVVLAPLAAADTAVQHGRARAA